MPDIMLRGGSRFVYVFRIRIVGSTNLRSRIGIYIVPTPILDHETISETSHSLGILAQLSSNIYLFIFVKLLFAIFLLTEVSRSFWKYNKNIECSPCTKLRSQTPSCRSAIMMADETDVAKKKTTLNNCK